MKVGVAGASGFVGRHLARELLERGHDVVAIDIRDPGIEDVDFFETDVRDTNELQKALEGVDAAYYLVHSMSGWSDFEEEERKSAESFREACNPGIQQVVYLTGIVPEGASSRHLSSRGKVGEILSGGDYCFTELRAAMIMGDGSASYELMRDIVNNLPVMVTPRWLESVSQPIHIDDVVEYLMAVLDSPEACDRSFDIGGPDRLSYREMLERYAEIKGLKRYFIPVPFLSPGLSAHWLHFVTSQDYDLAASLVQSLRYDLDVEKEIPEEISDLQPLGFEEAVRRIEGME